VAEFQKYQELSRTLIETNLQHASNQPSFPFVLA
jgi:hypothetical protein